MDSGPRELPGARSLGNGTGTAEEQQAPPPARAAEPSLGPVGVSEVTQADFRYRGRGFGSLSRDPCGRHGRCVTRVSFLKRKGASGAVWSWSWTRGRKSSELRAWPRHSLRSRPGSQFCQNNTKARQQILTLKLSL